MVRDSQRPRKQRKKHIPQLFLEDSEDDCQVEPNEPARNRRIVPSTMASEEQAMRINIPLGAGVVLTDEKIERMLAFCCHNCGCPKDRKREIPEDDRFVTPDDTSLWHRRCCHRVFGPPGLEWLSPYDEAYYLACEDGLKKYKSPSSTTVPVGMEELRKVYNTAKRQESELHNDDELPDPMDLLRTNLHYHNNEKQFIKHREKVRSAALREATVVDLFGGIGSAIVCLKRLKIAIKKIIHVEHDMVANHVYKSNHDCAYSTDLPNDTIEHVYIHKYEEFEANIDDIAREHGPLDIVIGGPPCVDYTPINAYHQGVDGPQGQFMRRFGELIANLNRNLNEPIWFLAENTALRNSRDAPLYDGDLERIKGAFEVEWEMLLDSCLFSPIRRKRTYITNVPLMLEPSDYCDPEPSSCLNDGFDVPGKIVEPGITAKAQGLMASKGRIDDEPRMLVFRRRGRRRQNRPQIEKRTLTVEERENLMGFSKGYISKAVKGLFKILLEEGFEKRFQTHEKSNWHSTLPNKYHCFSGDYHGFKNDYEGEAVAFNSTDNYLALMLAPPMTGSAPLFYTWEQYAKRLVGNSFSIPTVEILLRPLQGLFASREYETCDYRFAWQEASNVACAARGAEEGGEACSESAANPTYPAPADSSCETTDLMTMDSDEDLDDRKIPARCNGIIPGLPSHQKSHREVHNSVGGFPVRCEEVGPPERDEPTTGRRKRKIACKMAGRRLPNPTLFHVPTRSLKRERTSSFSSDDTSSSPVTKGGPPLNALPVFRNDADNNPTTTSDGDAEPYSPEVDKYGNLII